MNKSPSSIHQLCSQASLPSISRRVLRSAPGKSRLRKACNNNNNNNSINSNNTTPPFSVAGTFSYDRHHTSHPISLSSATHSPSSPTLSSSASSSVSSFPHASLPFLHSSSVTYPHQQRRCYSADITSESLSRGIPRNYIIRSNYSGFTKGSVSAAASSAAAPTTPSIIRTTATMTPISVDDPELTEMSSDKVQPVDRSSRPPVVCVFCGAHAGNTEIHMKAAQELARALHEAGIKLVYGAGTVGIMGEVARSLVELSGPDAVHGVIPEALIKYEQSNLVGMEGVEADNSETPVNPIQFGRTTVVKDMHTRKHLMAREVIEGGPGSGFIALSGGYGTMEELMEVTTWNQLGIHDRPIVVYNVDGYWDGLLSWIRNSVKSGFVAEGNSNIIVEAKTAPDVITCLNTYTKAAGRLNLQWDQE